MVLPVCTITMNFMNYQQHTDLAKAVISGVSLDNELTDLGLVMTDPGKTDVTTAPAPNTITRTIAAPYNATQGVGPVFKDVAEAKKEIKHAIKNCIPQRAHCQMSSMTVDIV